MKPTLVVLAAGMGSRYGSLKQLDGIGPQGETLMDYTIYDAIQAGFGKVVFVIRTSFAVEFQEKVTSRFAHLIEVEKVYQELDWPFTNLMSGMKREKPWGTGHAMLTAQSVVHSPFAVVNADDYYGRSSLESMARFLREDCQDNCFGMIGFPLVNTLSKNGWVSRGLCTLEGGEWLASVVERTEIGYHQEEIVYLEKGVHHPVTGETPVSMNLWGFPSTVFPLLEEAFHHFVQTRGQDPRAEFYIPLFISEVLQNQSARVKVIPTQAQWYGITYREDREDLQKAIAEKIRQSFFPNPLWK